MCWSICVVPVENVQQREKKMKRSENIDNLIQWIRRIGIHERIYKSDIRFISSAKLKDVSMSFHALYTFAEILMLEKFFFK